MVKNNIIRIVFLICLFMVILMRNDKTVSFKGKYDTFMIQDQGFTYEVYSIHAGHIENYYTLRGALEAVGTLSYYDRKGLILDLPEYYRNVLEIK